MYADMHNHFVYGVDDGCKTKEIMEKLLTALHEDGITRLISTAHITPGQRHFPMEDYLLHFEEAKAFVQANQWDLSLYTGNEILYTDAAPRYLREKKALMLGRGEFVLVEFLPNEKYPRLQEAAQKLRNAGYRPVFAHIERYEAMNDLKHVREMKHDFGVRLQVNCHSFTDKQPFLRRRWLGRLISEELLDYVSTDTHDMPGREPCMNVCFQALEKEFGHEIARALTWYDAQELLEET